MKGFRQYTSTSDRVSLPIKTMSTAINPLPRRNGRDWNILQNFNP